MLLYQVTPSGCQSDSLKERRKKGGGRHTVLFWKGPGTHVRFGRDFLVSDLALLYKDFCIQGIWWDRGTTVRLSLLSDPVPVLVPIKLELA